MRVGPRARRVSVLLSRSEQPVSEPAGYRRQSFLVEGQQVLVGKCTSEHGMNDFASGLLAGGPERVPGSTATARSAPSGSFESWSSGRAVRARDGSGLGIRLTNDSTRAQGAGWTAANSVVWNWTAEEIVAVGPEGAENLMNNSPSRSTTRSWRSGPMRGSRRRRSPSGARAA